jgi:hypothetical protein
MGKKSKKGTKGGRKSPPTSTMTTLAVVVQNADLKVIPQFESYQEMLEYVACKGLSNKLLPTLGTWRVYIGRSNCWCESNSLLPITNIYLG